MYRLIVAAALIACIIGLAVLRTTPSGAQTSATPTENPAYPAPGLIPTPTDDYPPIEPTWPPVGTPATPGPDATPPVMPPRDAWWYLPIIDR